jgi:hypothetical protein
MFGPNALKSRAVATELLFVKAFYQFFYLHSYEQTKRLDVVVHISSKANKSGLKASNVDKRHPSSSPVQTSCADRWRAPCILNKHGALKQAYKHKGSSKMLVQTDRNGSELNLFDNGNKSEVYSS